jgi:hypothetical protein
MFFKFLAAFLIASVLIYLGSLSVWVTVLALSVKALLATLAVVLVGALAVYMWKRYQSASIKQLTCKQ